MSELLDYATVLRINAYFYVLMPLTIWLVLGFPTRRSILLWSFAGLLAGFSVYLISLRGVIADVWSFLVAQSTVLAAFLLLAQPLRMDYGRPWPWRWLWGVMALYAALLIWLFDLRKSDEVAVLVRIANSAALIALTSSAISLARHEKSRNAWYMVWGYGLFTTAMAINAFVTWLHEGSLYALQHGVLNHVMGLISILTILLTYMGYLGLALEQTQRINVKLRQDQAEAQQWSERARELTMFDRQRTLTMLAKSLGHEILQHLTSTQLNLQLAQRLLQSSPTDQVLLQHSLEKANGGLVRCAQQVDRIRGFIKPAHSRTEVLSLNAVVFDTRDLLRQEIIFRRIDFEVIVPELPVWIQAEALSLTQALVQVLRNAMHAVQGRSVCRICLELVASADRAILEVRDSGPGFKPEMLNQQTSRLVASANAHRSLGLYITQGIVSQFDGQISWDNHEGGGARVTISFPLSVI